MRARRPAFRATPRATIASARTALYGVVGAGVQTVSQTVRHTTLGDASASELVAQPRLSVDAMLVGGPPAPRHDGVALSIGVFVAADVTSTHAVVVALEFPA